MWTEACHLQLTLTEEKVEEEEEVGGKTEEEGGGLRERERLGAARGVDALGASLLQVKLDSFPLSPHLESPADALRRLQAGVLLLAAVPAAFLLVLLPGSGE